MAVSLLAEVKECNSLTFEKYYSQLLTDKSNDSLGKQEIIPFLKRLFNLGSGDTVNKILERVFLHFDKKNSGAFAKEEFLLLFSLVKGNLGDKEILTFSAFNCEGTTAISPSQFTPIIHVLWNNKDAQELFDFFLDEAKHGTEENFVKYYFDEADKNKDGLVDFEEFKSALPKFHNVEKATLEHQTGGHAGAFKSLDEDRIMKAVGGVELNFFKKLKNEWSFMAPWCPRLYAIEEDQESKKTWVTMENLVGRMQKPCVMDCKMGKSTADPNTSPLHIASMEKKDSVSSSSQIGFRITGAKVWRTSCNSYAKFTKEWGSSLKVPEGVENGLAEFFQDGPVLRKEVIQKYYDLVSQFEEWFSNQKRLKFYSASLLFVYDGADPINGLAKLKLIDFAHVLDINDGKPDENFLFGVTNLKSILQNLLKR